MSLRQHDDHDESQKQNWIPSPIARRFLIKNFLGKGAYGAVWEAEYRQGDMANGSVALKRIQNALHEPYEGETTQEVDYYTNCTKKVAREMEAHRKLNGHQNIVRLIDTLLIEGSSDVWFVLQKAETDLYQLLKYGDSVGLKRRHRKGLLFGLLCGLLWMHSANIIHRDLKPANVFVDRDLNALLADLGECRVLLRDKDLTACLGTPLYSPPEVLNGTERYGMASDMWSMGCIIFEATVDVPEADVDRNPRHPFCRWHRWTDAAISLGIIQEREVMNFSCLFAIFEVVGLPSNSVPQQWANQFHVSARDEELTRKRCWITKWWKAVLSMEPELERYGIDSRVSDKEAADLIKKLLVWEPEKRLTVKQALDHPFFDQVRPRGHGGPAEHIHSFKDMLPHSQRLKVIKLIQSKAQTLSRLDDHVETEEYYRLLDSYDM